MGVVVVSAVLGNTFTSLVGPSYTDNPQERRKLDENLSYDDKVRLFKVYTEAVTCARVVASVFLFACMW